MTAHIQIKPSATVADCFWFSCRLNGEIIAQTCKEHEHEGISTIKARVLLSHPGVKRFLIRGRVEDAEPPAH